MKDAIEITKRGLEIEGDCAQGLLKVMIRNYEVSKKSKAEIFGCTCLNPKTGKAEKTIVGNIGSSTSVSTEGVERVCPKDTLQVSYHTHPVSGKAKFSPSDGSTIVDRFNRGYDDGHCVVGKDDEKCILQTRLKKGK